MTFGCDQHGLRRRQEEVLLERDEERRNDVKKMLETSLVMIYGS